MDFFKEKDMTEELKIRCKNNGKQVEVPFGSTLYEVYAQCELQMEYGPVVALVNNKVKDMNYRFYNNKDVYFLDLHTQAGLRAYTRSLVLVLAKAVEDLYPHGQILMGSRVCRGFYCELRIGRPVAKDDIIAIKGKMQEIVDADMPIQRIQCPIEEAKQLFQERGMKSKVELLNSQDILYTDYYQLEQTVDYFYGPLLTHTGLLTLFDVVPLYDGLLLRIPSKKDPSRLEELVPQPKMLEVIREHNRWQDIIGVRTVGELNAAVMAGKAAEIINVSEALQEKKLSRMSDEIEARHARLVLIAGPSSSGKTTTSKRLAVQMLACGLRPYILSTDDYFVNRVDTPLDENGEYDFECIGAVDTAFFNQQMNELLQGKEVELPRYDFPSGKRVFEGRKLQIGPQDIIILEGNHALNPILTQQIPEEQKFRIFVAGLSQKLKLRTNRQEGIDLHIDAVVAHLKLSLIGHALPAEHMDAFDIVRSFYRSDAVHVLHGSKFSFFH